MASTPNRGPSCNACHGYWTPPHPITSVTWDSGTPDSAVEPPRPANRPFGAGPTAADPAVTETIKRSVQPYFVLDGNICALLAAKDHVNVFIYDPTVSDPDGVINEGHGNATARAIQIYRDDRINSDAVLALFRGVIANNRGGGWRKLRR